MDYMVAHSFPGSGRQFVAPLTALGYLVPLDWRLTLITFAPIGLRRFLGDDRQRYSSQMAGHAAPWGG